jgi:hypothetical protein
VAALIHEKKVRIPTQNEAEAITKLTGRRNISNRSIESWL